MGREVVQVYLACPGSTVEHPVRWFAGCTAERAEPGQRATVDVAVEPHLLRQWSHRNHVWRTEAGTYRLTVGRSAGDIRWEGPVTLTTAP
ncbi:fibronectin type III-like domain-contianing protein [Streptomyces sp. NPDC014006]|uniref:fibronectin type III-like domain-contianing protein n=1 Tax=Streptomyces sp. NPDC014006 TaxID=3364870 RepID=UPI0036F984F2